MPTYKRITRNVLVHERTEEGRYVGSHAFQKGDLLSEESSFYDHVPDHSVEQVTTSEPQKTFDGSGDDDSAEETDTIDVANSTIDAVLAWVDKPADEDERTVRADQAMAQETSSGKPRVRLVAELRDRGAE
jgi:hypothetical protein